MALKIMTILGTRPDIIKLSCIIKELNKRMEHILVHTGQNYDYELNEIFFNDLDLPPPNYFLNTPHKGLSSRIGHIISEIDPILEKEKPDAVLFYGDTNSTLAAISVKRRQIPIFHMEAGNRCFDQRVPEEINRKIIDHLSDINMVHSEHARRYLLNEGIRPEMIIKTGSPMREVLNHQLPKIENSTILNELNLKKNDFFVVSAHREENLDYKKNLDTLMDSLEKVAKKFEKRIIFSTHPRTKNKIKEHFRDRKFTDLIEFVKPLGFNDYIKLQKEALCVISDSGTITEEAAIIGFSSVMIRQAHERPEGMDVGTVIMSGLETKRVLDSIELAINYKTSFPIQDYERDDVSKQVIKILQSYTDYINRTIWHKLD